MAAVNFIETDPTIAPYDKAEDQADKQGAIQQQMNVDTAVRSGINNMLDQQGAAGQSYQTPAAAPPTPAPPAPSATPPAAPATNVQQVTAQKESGNNPSVVNPQGYSGKYQFGKAALIDAGIYQPAPGEDISPQGQGPGQWWGTFNVPGRAQPITYQQFLNDPQAQDAAWNAHTADLNREITNRGLDKYIGQTVGGVPITQDSLIEMMHGGGPSGVQKFLQTGGQYNPADANGQTLANFGMRVAGGAPVQAPPSPSIDVTNAVASGAPPGVPTAFMPGFNESRYDPILRSLAATPGGGTAALSLLNNQGRFDQMNYRRMDTYQRLAMSALAHGDTQTARYYAAAGGMQLPDNVMSPQGNGVLLGRGSLLAQRIYGSDPQQAQRFLQTYLTNGGDVTSAFNAAGTPRSNPNYKLAWAQQEDGTLKAYAFSPRTGDATAVNGSDQQPLVAQPKPNQASLSLDHKIDLLTSTGMPRNEAVQAATGVGLRPATIANAYQRIYSSYANSIAGMNASEPERQQAVEAQMGNLFGPNWKAQMGTTGGAGGYQTPGAAPPTPQTGTAVPNQALATPGAGGPMAAPTGGDQAASIANARAAIARGVPRAAVIQRLTQNHIPIPADL